MTSSTLKLRFTDKQFKNRYWETCKTCGESIVVATLKTGQTKVLNTVVQDANAQVEYTTHVCRSENDDE